MRYRGFEITSCYDTGIERYNQQTGEDEICSGYFCEIYPAGDDQYANQLDAFCLAEGHEIADTTQGSLENGIIRYVDGHYGYLQEEKEEVRQKRTEELAGRLIGYLGETQEGAALYRILSRDICHLYDYDVSFRKVRDVLSKESPGEEDAEPEKGQKDAPNLHI